MSNVEHTRMSSSSSCDEGPMTDKKNDINSAKSPRKGTSEGSDDGPSRFAGVGVDFRGKLIGVEDVAEPRGDKMCQVAMAKLKAAVKATGEHKRKIVVNVSLDGVKVIDEKSTEILHTHLVHRISFIARDTADSRAFGYVYRRPDGNYQFIGIKTDKAADGLVCCLRDLFQAVFELKKKSSAEADADRATTATSGDRKSSSSDRNSTDAKSTDDEKSPPASSTEAKTDDEKTEENLLNLDLDFPDTSQKIPLNLGAPSWVSVTADPWNSSVHASPTVPSHVGPGGLVTTNISVQPTAVFYPSAAQPGLLSSPAYFAQVIPQPTSQPMIGSPFHVPQPHPGTTASPFGVAGAFPQPAGLMVPPPPTAAAAHGWPSPVQAIGVRSGGTSSSTVGQHPWPTSSPFDDTPSASSDPFVVQTTVAVHGTAVARPASLAAPLIPARRPGAVAASPGNPFTSPTTGNGNAGGGGGRVPSDPFADLGLLAGALPPPPHGRKTEKRDFFVEPPKPTLKDLTMQQQQQQISAGSTSVTAGSEFMDIFGAKPFVSVTPANDPFA